MTSKRTLIVAQVDATDRAQLEQRAKQGDRSLSAEIRRALREHLERPAERKPA